MSFRCEGSGVERKPYKRLSTNVGNTGRWYGAGMDLSHKTPLFLEVMARWLNPMLRGWINYYGRFYQSAIDCIASHIDLHHAKWVTHKYKQVHSSLTQVYEWLRRIQSAKYCLFAHWETCTRRERSTTRTG